MKLKRQCKFIIILPKENILNFLTQLTRARLDFIIKESNVIAGTGKGIHARKMFKIKQTIK